MSHQRMAEKHPEGWRATRRDLFRGAAGLAIGCALGTPLAARAAGDPLTVMTPFGFVPDFLEMMNMVSGGFLERQGFDATLRAGHGTATAIQQMMSGSAAFARMTAIDVFTANAKGAKLLAISTLYQGSNFHVISLKDKPINSAAEMKGKTIGVVSINGSTEQLLDIMLRSAGLTKNDVKVQVVGNNPGVLEFIKQGRVDCVINSLAVVVALQEAKEPIANWPTDRYAPMPSQIYVTTQDFADKNPDKTVRFLKALIGSTKDMMHGDIAAVLTRAAKDFDIPGIKKMDEQIALVKFAIQGPWVSEGEKNFLRNVPELWAKASDEINKAGIASTADVRTLYTNDFIDKALAT